MLGWIKVAGGLEPRDGEGAVAKGFMVIPLPGREEALSEPVKLPALRGWFGCYGPDSTVGEHFCLSRYRK